MLIKPNITWSHQLVTCEVTGRYINPRGLIETISLILNTDAPEDSQIAHMLGTALYFSYAWWETKIFGK
jgi:hypothetical protein